MTVNPEAEEDARWLIANGRAGMDGDPDRVWRSVANDPVYRAELERDAQAHILSPLMMVCERFGDVPPLVVDRRGWQRSLEELAAENEALEAECARLRARLANQVHK